MNFTPLPLHEWACNNDPSKELRWADAFWCQVMFVRDRLPSAFVTTEAEWVNSTAMVVSTHRSKSVLLPVYRLTTPCGAVVTMRNNFYDWKVSVDSPIPIPLNLGHIISERGEEHPISPIYCEGFDPEWVYGRYADNKQRFTVEILDEYRLWAFLWQFPRVA